MSICIGPDAWVNITLPVNAVAGSVPLGIRFEEASNVYRFRGSFVTTGLVANNSTISLPSGFAPTFTQRVRALVQSGQGEYEMDVDTSGVITVRRGLTNGYTVVFDGLVIAAS